jgi:predicted enzyme related to lactoylglutathione lyase
VGYKVVHFEVNGPDGEALERFYTELFGWSAERIPGGYALVDTNGGSGVNGGIGSTEDGSSSVIFYVGATDPQVVLDRAASLGGTTAKPVTVIPEVVTFALLADPDGLVTGVVQIDDRQGPSPTAGGGTPVDWFEVLGSDAEATQRFYTELFGWTVESTGAPGYGLVDTGAGDGAVGGGLGGGGVDATWVTVYAHVPDVEAALTKAEALGGSREYGPVAVDDHMRTGALRDPAGNVFGVYEHAH